MKEILAGKTIRVIKKAFSQRKDVLLAYIFGSRVAGFEAKNSDLDLAVFVRDKKKLSERDILYLLENLPIASSLHVSCVNLDSPPLFLYQIIKNGDCIYAKDKGERVKLEARILDLYYDNQHIRNIYRHYLQKSLREGTYGH